MNTQTELRAMLESISVSVHPDRYTVVTISEEEPSPRLGQGVAAFIEESEGTTVVATVQRARIEALATPTTDLS